MSSDKATAKGSLLGAWLPKEHTTRVAEFIQRSNLRSKMADEETQAGSPPVVVPNSIEQSLRGHFERILLISEVAAASLAEQVMWGGWAWPAHSQNGPVFTASFVQWLAVGTKAALAAANYVITPGMQFNYITAGAASTATQRVD